MFGSVRYSVRWITELDLKSDEQFFSALGTDSATLGSCKESGTLYIQKVGYSLYS